MKVRTLIAVDRARSKEELTRRRAPETRAMPRRGRATGRGRRPRRGSTRGGSRVANIRWRNRPERGRSVIAAIPPARRRISASISSEGSREQRPRQRSGDDNGGAPRRALGTVILSYSRSRCQRRRVSEICGPGHRVNPATRTAPEGATIYGARPACDSNGTACIARDGSVAEDLRIYYRMMSTPKVGDCCRSVQAPPT